MASTLALDISWGTHPSAHATKIIGAFLFVVQNRKGRRISTCPSASYPKLIK